MRALLVSSALAFAGGAQAQSLSLTGSCPGPVDIEISGVTPGTSVFLLSGSGPGSVTIPAGPCRDFDSGLAAPLKKVAGPLRDADRDGVVTVSPTIPWPACDAFVVALDAVTCDMSEPETFGVGGGDRVLFATDRFIDGGTSLASRLEADDYCADYAASNGIAGSDFRIVYSTPAEDALDFLDYAPGDAVYDRDGALLDDVSIWEGGILLPYMESWTITNTWGGVFYECDGVYAPGGWPICQYCDQKFACASEGNDPFEPDSCCWTGTRGIVCMGTL